MLLAIVFIVVSAIVAAACERFFTLDATVTDCTTHAPLADVTALLHLDHGSGENDVTRVTGEDGRLHFVLNAIDSATATLTLTKTGYETWSRQYQTDPDGPISICLNPTGQ